MYIIKIWGESATNYLQILHMSFGIGALIVPLITRPFLLPLNRDEEDGIRSNGTALVNGYSPDDVMIQYPYLITGLFICSISIPFGIFYLKELRNPAQYESLTEESKDKKESQSFDWRKYVAIIPMALIANIAFGFTTLVGKCFECFFGGAFFVMKHSSTFRLLRSGFCGQIGASNDQENGSPFGNRFLGNVLFL